jgi:cellulose biosynthesis protein BcsQ
MLVGVCDVMEIVVLASRKGGAGKTTLAAHLAVAAERSGVGKVVVIDADPMGGLATWWNARQSETLGFSRFDRGSLKQNLESLRADGVNLVVIDTPPAASEGVAAIMATANLVVIPVIPSPNDLVAVGDTLEIVEDARKANSVRHQQRQHQREADAAGNRLSQRARSGCCSGGSWVVIHTRQDFRSP